ncbi:MAG TPA: hypothetical protein PLS73_06735 [Saprospiraceae bacterium]|nr:hypothetical protein [Saprospiraceae bacterium]
MNFNYPIALMMTLHFIITTTTTYGKSADDIFTIIKAKFALQQEPLLKLKSFQLTAVKLLDQNKLSESTKLDSVGRAQYKIEQIDAFYDNSYVYHLVDTLLMEANRQLVLIGREYINENIVWMCYYSNDKLVYSKQVYYDNAEGNYLLESKLEKQNLILNSDDVNEGKRTVRFKINNRLEWKPIPLVKKKQ